MFAYVFALAFATTNESHGLGRKSHETKENVDPKNRATLKFYWIIIVGVDIAN